MYTVMVFKDGAYAGQISGVGQNDLLFVAKKLAEAGFTHWRICRP